MELVKMVIWQGVVVLLEIVMVGGVVVSQNVWVVVVPLWVNCGVFLKD
jgi:hypothetical protein